MRQRGEKGRQTTIVRGARDASSSLLSSPPRSIHQVALANDACSDSSTILTTDNTTLCVRAWCVSAGGHKHFKQHLDRGGEGARARERERKRDGRESRERKEEAGGAKDMRLVCTIGYDHKLASLFVGMFVPNARTLSHPHHNLLDALTLCTLCAVGCYSVQNHTRTETLWSVLRTTFAELPSGSDHHARWMSLYGRRVYRITGNYMRITPAHACLWSVAGTKS